MAQPHRSDSRHRSSLRYVLELCVYMCVNVKGRAAGAKLNSASMASAAAATFIPMLSPARINIISACADSRRKRALAQVASTIASLLTRAKIRNCWMQAPVNVLVSFDGTSL